MYIHINRERELLLINEENNVSCVTPNFSKIQCLPSFACFVVGLPPSSRKTCGPSLVFGAEEQTLSPIRGLLASSGLFTPRPKGRLLGQRSQRSVGCRPRPRPRRQDLGQLLS